MVVREGRLVGGCRPWGFTFPIAAALSAPASRLARGGHGLADRRGARLRLRRRRPGGKRYVVTLRPLLPGEQP